MAQYIINRNRKGGTIATTIALQMIASIPGMHMPLADCEEPTRDLLVTIGGGSVRSNPLVKINADAVEDMLRSAQDDDGQRA
jgi:hypothetical protein